MHFSRLHFAGTGRAHLTVANAVTATLTDARPDLALRAYVLGACRCPLDGSRVAPAEAARLARELGRPLAQGGGDCPGRHDGPWHPGRGGGCCAGNARVRQLAHWPALGIAAASVGWGVTTLEESVGGLGGCPYAGPQSMGNVATEDLVYMLDAMGVDTGGVSWKGLLDSGAWLRD